MNCNNFGRCCPCNPCAGPTGPTGPAGPQGSLIRAAGTFYSTSIETVLNGAMIPINSGSEVVGNGITLQNATDVLIQTPGIYLAGYYFQGDPIDGIEALACRLLLNGQPISGTTVQSVTSPEANIVEPSVTNMHLIVVSGNNSILQLQNYSNAAIAHLRWVDNVTTASLTVLRLS